MTFLQNYILERRLNKLIRQGHFEAPERFSNGVYTTYVCETFKLESKTPNDIHIVASVLSDLDGQYYYTPYKCSVALYDPNFKILNKKHSPKGELSEDDTVFAQRIFSRLSNLYHQGR